MRPCQKTLVLALAFLAICVVETVSAGPAVAGLAARWKVKGAFLGGASKNFIAHNTEALRLDSAALEVFIESPKGECVMTGKIVGSGMETPGTKKEVGMVCTNTEVLTPAACTIKSPGQEIGTVTTAPMKSTLVWETKGGEAAGDLYSAEGKGPIGEIILEGAMCGPNGTYAIEQEALAPLTPVAEQTKVATQAFPEAFPTTWWNNHAEIRQQQAVSRLTLGGEPALIRSSFEVKLNPEEQFGYAPG